MKKLSKEHKEKIALAHIGVALSEEHKKNISIAHRGKILSKEHKEKLSKSQKNCIQIICLNDGQMFNSMSKCAKHYDINIGNLSKHLRGRTNQIGGLTFAYHNEGDR